jgi:hypothetical protein
VRIWINGGDPVFEDSKLLVSNEIWYCAEILWPQGIIREPAIFLEKTADVITSYPGGTINYSYEVTNIGDVPLDNIWVEDDKCEPLPQLKPDSEFNEGDINENGILDPGETWIFTASYTVNIEDPEALINIASAHGTWAYGDTTFTDTCGTFVIINFPQ